MATYDPRQTFKAQQEAYGRASGVTQQQEAKRSTFKSPLDNDRGSTYDEVPQVLTKGLGSRSTISKPEEKTFDRKIYEYFVNAGASFDEPEQEVYALPVYESPMFKIPTMPEVTEQGIVDPFDQLNVNPFKFGGYDYEARDQAPQVTKMQDPDMQDPRKGLMSAPTMDQPSTPEALIGMPRGLALGNATPSKSYLIKDGDTLSQIAKDNNTTVKAILDLNSEIEDKNVIDAGARIEIPLSDTQAALRGGLDRDKNNEGIQTALSDNIMSDAFSGDAITDTMKSLERQIPEYESFRQGIEPLDVPSVEDTTRTPDDIEAPDYATMDMGEAGRSGIMSNPKDTRYFEAGRGNTTETGGGKAKTIQSKLNRLGYDAGAVDGAIGGGSKRAIRKFQKQHGLEPTGNLDIEQYNLLISNEAKQFSDPRQEIPASEIESITSDKGDFEVMKKALAKIESGPHGYTVYKYNTGKHKAGDLLYGGANNHYLGKYQMGKDALSDVGVGYTKAEREAFLKDPAAQDKAFKKYTENNHKKLTRESERYRNMTKEEKLGVLGYAHNQGATAAVEWLFTGVSGNDAFGTKGTKYTTKIAEAFADPNAQDVRDFYEVTP